MSRRRIFARLLLVVVSLGASLTLAEIAVRVFRLGPEISAVERENYRLSENPRLRYELVPGSRDQNTVINPDGMRDRAYPLEKSAGTVRIASLGDSICMGFGCTRDQTYSSRLEALLNRSAPAGRTYEVLNFGVTGYNVGQSVEVLRSKALAYDPDLVIYQYCLNDPQDFSWELETLAASLTPAQRSYWERRIRPGGGWIARSRLVALAAYVWQSRSAEARRTPTPGDVEDPQWISLQQGTYADYFRRLHDDPVAWERVTDGFDRLAAVARDRRLPVLVVVFPVFLDLQRYPLEDVHRKVTDEAARHGFNTVDLLDVYRARQRRFRERLDYNALHPSATGHEIAAVVLQTELPALDPR